MGAVSGGGASWSLASKEWDSSLPAGDTIDIKFIVGYSGARVGTVLRYIIFTST